MKIPNYQPYRKRAWFQAVYGPLAPLEKEFVRRIRGKEPPWIPSTYFHFADAADVFGKARIPEWNGTERTARHYKDPPDPPWLWGALEDVNEEYFIVSEDNKRVDTTESAAEDWWAKIEPAMKVEWEAINASRARWLTCLNQMRNALALGKVVAYMLEKTGSFSEIPKDAWVSERGETMIADGFTNYSRLTHSYTAKAEFPVVLKRDFLDEFEREGTTEVEPTTKIDQNVFPYLAFMIDAATNGPFEADVRIPKKEIEYWLQKNWPPHLGEPTPNKLATMATLLRRPEHERGGLKKGTKL